MLVKTYPSTYHFLPKGQPRFGAGAKAWLPSRGSQVGEG